MGWPARIALLAAVLAACDDFERRDRPWPDLELKTLEGTPIPVESMAGSPWLVSVWLPRCGSCAHEVPEVEAVRQQYESRGVKFLALSINDDPVIAAQGAKTMGISIPVAVAGGPVMDKLGVRVVPATVVVSPDGRIVGSASGLRSRQSLARRLDRLLAP